jgi:hypothetical protein
MEPMGRVISDRVRESFAKRIIEKLGSFPKDNPRDVIAVRTRSGEVQPFYRRTGEGSRGEAHKGAQKGEWAPFGGFILEWGHFYKEAFTKGISKWSPVYRYGTWDNRNISKALALQPIPKGEAQGWQEIQKDLLRLGAKVLPVY